MRSSERYHQAYLVRLWAVHRNGELLWRASIQNIHSGERHAFADLAGLYRFLEQLIAQLAVTPPAEVAPRIDDKM